MRPEEDDRLERLIERVDSTDNILPLMRKEVITPEVEENWKKDCIEWYKKKDPLVIIWFRTHLFLLDQLRLMCDLEKISYEGHIFSFEVEPSDAPWSGRLIIGSDILQHKLKYRVRDDIGECIIRPGKGTLKSKCNIADLYDYDNGYAANWCDGMISHPTKQPTPLYKMMNKFMNGCIGDIDEIDNRPSYNAPYNWLGRDPRKED